MSQIIYIVKSSCGVYEDFCEWNEKAFLNIAMADSYAKKLDSIHNKKPQFITDEFIEAYNIVTTTIPDWGEGPKLFEDKEAYFAWQDECSKKDAEYIISEMCKRGFHVTEQILEQYEEWENNFYKDWHKCEIEKLELV